MLTSKAKGLAVLAATLFASLAFGVNSAKADPGCGGGRYYYGSAPVYYYSGGPTYYAYRSCPPPVYYYAPSYVVRDCGPAPCYRGGGFDFSVNIGRSRGYDYGRSYSHGGYGGYRGGSHHSRRGH